MCPTRGEDDISFFEEGPWWSEYNISIDEDIRSSVRWNTIKFGEECLQYGENTSRSEKAGPM